MTYLFISFADEDSLYGDYIDPLNILSSILIPLPFVVSLLLKIDLVSSNVAQGSKKKS